MLNQSIVDLYNGAIIHQQVMRQRRRETLSYHCDVPRARALE